MKPTPNGQDSRKNLDETRKKTKNPRKTRPNNTPQDPLGSQEGISKRIPLFDTGQAATYIIQQSPGGEVAQAEQAEKNP